MAVNDKSLHMPTMSLDLEDLDRICLFLDESMVTYNFMGRSQTFLPRRALEIATQRCVIEAYLRRDQDLKLESLGFVAFLDRVYSYARKLFIICMYCDMGLPFLRSLINRHLSDKNLPLVPSDCPSPKYQRGFNSGFLRIQNHFNAAVFEKNSHQVLDDTRPIPIELPGRVECLLRKGAFGDIYRIKIHKDQHSFSSLNDQGDGLFALKICHHESASEREKNFNTAMATLDHQNLAKCLASFSFDNAHYSIYPLAEGNLEEFMEMHRDLNLKPHPTLTENWLVEQLRGLAGALSVLHDQENEPKDQNQFDGLRAGFRRTGYIHDIKPENILVVTSSGQELLRISDLTCTKIVEFFASMNFKRTKHLTTVRGGTPNYRPPESHTGKTSRPYDLWSLGCVYLELLTWFLEGYEELESFRAARQNLVCPGKYEDEGFCFTAESGSDANWQLRHAVTAKLDVLRPKCQGPMKSILDIVPSLLRVNPKERPTAVQLIRILNTAYDFSFTTLRDYESTIESASQARFEGVEISTAANTHMHPKDTYKDSTVGTISGTADTSEIDSSFDDTATCYTKATDANPFMRNIAIESFADMIIQSLQKSGFESIDYAMIKSGFAALDDLLKSFAIRLAYDKLDGMSDAVIFVHRYRKPIAQELRRVHPQRNEDADSRLSRDQIDVDKNDMINDWNNKSKDFEPMNYQEVEVDDRFGDEIDVEESTPNLDLEKYRESIKASEAFRWLIAEMCCSIVLSTPDPNVRAEVRAVVLDVFPAPRHLSRHSLAPVYHASFAMDWDVLGFLREQYEDDPSYAVETAITLTGTIQEAQALTCRQYLEQTWPRIGSVVVQLLKDSVETAAETSSSVRMLANTTITMGTSKHQTIVQAKGSRDSLAEVGEVFAWLGAAIRTNPGSVSVGYCQVKVVACPLGVSTDRTSRSFQMSFEIREPIIRDENGTCWTKLFRNPVIAIGFPILTRPQKETGLELSLPMMAGLSQAKYVVQFDNVPFVKGFSTMLIPTHYSSGSTTWHLLYNEDRKRISYQDCRVSACQNQALKHASMFEIERSRHIVGWSSSVKVYAGAKEGNYSIQRSGYTDRIPGLDLERLSLSVGNVATVGTSFAIGVKDVPLHLSREGTYVDKIRDIHASFFIFFDTDDRRGWMVNGATALLHIVRAHLEDLRNSLFYSEDDCFSPKDFQEASEPYLSDSAVQVLLSKHNRQLVISSDEVNHRTEITREERNLIKKVEKWDERQFRFQDLVEQKWHILEQILDSQCSRDSSGVKVKPPTRQYLRGFDFADVATPTQDLSLKVTTLKACGKAWIGFSQAIRAITLFGRGFGDVFVPTKTSNNLCSHWKEVPKGYDCLVACIEDLNKLTTQRGNPKAVPARLVEDLCWHKPNMLFEACECKNKKNKSRRRLFTRNESCLRIQEFVSADSNYQKINSPGSLVSFKHGAAIFGRSSHDVTGWKSKITEELEREDTTQIELKPESQPADSGLGSSVVSVDSLKTTSKSSKKKIAFATKTNVS